MEEQDKIWNCLTDKEKNSWRKQYQVYLSNIKEYLKWEEEDGYLRDMERIELHCFIGKREMMEKIFGKHNLN